MDLHFIIHLRFRLLHKGTNQPVTGHHYRVELYDDDLFQDDFLGEAQPDSDGYVAVDFSTRAFKSFDSVGEKLPDLYFRVLKDGVVIYQSPTAINVHVKEDGSFSMEEGVHYHLGTFLIEEPEQ